MMPCKLSYVRRCVCLPNRAGSSVFALFAVYTCSHYSTRKLIAVYTQTNRSLYLNYSLEGLALFWYSWLSRGQAYPDGHGARSVDPNVAACRSTNLSFAGFLQCRGFTHVPHFAESSPLARFLTQGAFISGALSQPEPHIEQTCIDRPQLIARTHKTLQIIINMTRA